MEKATNLINKTTAEESQVAEGATNIENLNEKGRDAAARFLELRGYKVLDRDWACPAGEVAIVAEDEGVLVFVEVNTRADASEGFEDEGLTDEKRKRYEMVAAYYLKEGDKPDGSVRFDVISLMVLKANKAFLRHHINAFGSEN